MSEPIADRRPWRGPAGLLGMLALVAAVELAVAGARDDLIRPLGESWRFAARAAETQATTADVLCFGDSLIKYGVLPKVIEARTGLHAYSLACSGGTAPASFFLLRNALGAGAQPKAVVVDFAALMPVDAGPPKLLSYPELATLRDDLDLASTSGDPSFLGAAMVARILPTARYRFEIRGSILAALDGRSTSERDSVRSHRLIWARERGAQPTEPVAGRVQPAPFLDLFCPTDWTCPAVDEAYIDRFLGLAGSRGIAVYWLLPPLSPEIATLRRAKESDLAYERFARAVAARHPGTVILDARHADDNGSTFIDPLHLDRRGAAVLTTDIAAIIAAGLVARSETGAAWVDLPSLGGRIGDDPTSKVARSPAVSR